MLNDKRREIRRPIKYTAWIAQKEKPLLGCVLADVSDKGARLEVETTENIPDNFMLFLSRRGSPRRQCRVAWRSETQLGVEYEAIVPPVKNKPAFKAMIAAKKASDAAAAAEPTETDDTKAPEPA